MTDKSLLRREAHPAITHCDNCGCDWLDNGLNPIGCPYCKQSASVDEVKEPDLWRCTVCGRVGTVGRCCGEETRERVNVEQLLDEYERLRAIIRDLMRELRRETERRWEGNRRAAQEYVEDMRDVLKEAAQICKDLDDEALAKEGRLACGTECAAAIADLTARWNVPFEGEVTAYTNKRRFAAGEKIEAEPNLT